MAAGKSRRPRGFILPVELSSFSSNGSLSQRVAAWQCRLKLEEKDVRIYLHPAKQQKVGGGVGNPRPLSSRPLMMREVNLACCA